MTKAPQSQKDDKAQAAAEEKAKIRLQPRFKRPVDEKEDEDLFNDMPV